MQLGAFSHLTRASGKQEALRRNGRYINGLRECHTVLYEAGRYPRAMIGPVRIIWKPEDPADSSEIGRKLLIVCHPDSKINILVQIDMAATAINQSLLDENVLSVVNIPAYNIFEIMGPKSGQALARVLELAKGNFKEASDVRIPIQFLICLRDDLSGALGSFLLILLQTGRMESEAGL